MLSLEGCVRDEKINRRQFFKILLSTYNAGQQEGKVALIRHRSSLQLQIQVVHPVTASVENEERVRDKDDALPWLQGQQCCLAVGCEAKSGSCAGVAAVPLHQSTLEESVHRHTQLGTAFRSTPQQMMLLSIKGKMQYTGTAPSRRHAPHAAETSHVGARALHTIMRPITLLYRGNTTARD